MNATTIRFALSVSAVVFLLGLPLGSPLGAQSDLALPGSVQATITPVAAVSGGAGWRIAGRPPKASGATETGLPPARHPVQFTKIPGWVEPSDQEVVVVGGKLQTVAAEYTPVPDYYFRGLPAQTARHGGALRFRVISSDPSDPESPQSGTGLTMKVAPQPTGAIIYDAALREFSYTPDAADRTDFVVTFTASTVRGPIEGTALISPLPSLPPEDSAIHFLDERVEPESNDYVRIREEASKTEELFNQRDQKTRKVSISGAWIVFEELSTKMPLYDLYSGDPDIKEMTIYADRVTIRSPLHLPQTSVQIYARELRFEGDGQLDVTQTSAPFPRFDGLDGVKGPDLVVQVERFHADASPAPRFISHGVNGLTGRGGRNGAPLRPSTELCGTHQGKTIIYETCANTEIGEIEVYCGAPTVFGENAVPHSRPGAGGNGGTIFSTLNLAPYADLAPGLAGPKAPDTKGGVPVNIVAKRWAGPPNNPCSSFTVSDRTGTPGRDGVSPPALQPAGLPGQVQLTADPGAWLHPVSVHSFLFYVKDLYLANDPELVRKTLDDYATAIRLLKSGLPEGEENAVFAQLAAKIESLLGAIDSNLDYFGNPLTWVPMLSFEANLTAFTQEIERAIPVLYFAYWIESAAQRAISTRDSIVAGKEKLEEEIDAALEAYEKALDEVPILTIESADLEGKMASVVAKLKQLEADLLKRAQQNVEDRHKVPFWRKALGVLGAITKVIPWGQPALGYAGVGLSLISSFDVDDPLAGLEKAPDLIKQIREADYVGCLKVKQEEGKKDTKKDRSARIARVNACAALAKAGIKDLREVFKTTAVAEGEVKAELDKLRAADPVFKALTAELAILTVEKQLLTERLVATMQVVTNTSTIVTEKLLAIQRLDQNLTSVLEVLDHQALLYVANMGRETKDRLLKYQYLMAKAYQYRILKPYTGSFKLAELFDELKALVTLDGAGHDLAREDFETLKAIYFGELSRITESIWIEYNSNAPARSSPVSFRLSQDELRDLNETGKLSIDLARRNLFGAREENLRIVSLATKDLAVRKTGQVGGTATLRLQFEHSGFSRIRSEGHGYLFTHYRTQRANPIVWSTVYSALTERWTETTISAAEESLLRALIESTGAGSDLLLYSRPGALAEILITKEVTADTSVTLDVEELVLELVYDYSTRSRFVHDLSVEVSDELKPLITLSKNDLDGRTDGRGDFLRGYQGATAVRLEAPAAYGEWKFKRWEAARGAGGGGLADVLGLGPVLEITVADDVAIRAVYASDESPSPASFRRGDANGDSRLDISDAVATLGFLFTGGVDPSCMDSADANDDGAVDLTDGVAILGYLFTGGTAPPSPGPDRCGEDATADSLDCGADPPCE